MYKFKNYKKNYGMDELTPYTYLVCDSIIILGEQMITKDLNSGNLNIDFQLISNIWTVLSIDYSGNKYKVKEQNGLLSLNIFKKHESDIYDEIKRYNEYLIEKELGLIDSMRLLRNKFTHSPNSIQSYGWGSVIQNDTQSKIYKVYEIFNGINYKVSVNIEYDKVKLILVRLIKILNRLSNLYQKHFENVVNRIDKGILDEKVRKANMIIKEYWMMTNEMSNDGIPL